MDRDTKPDESGRTARDGMPLRNPLPTPRRKKHTQMDYDIEPVHDGIQDEFDYETFPCDDFDI